MALLSVGLVSCEEPETVVPPKEYSTPTIKGKVSIPSGKNIKAEDIFVKVIDEEGKTVTIQKANADATFVIEGLSPSSKYSILFTSVEPEFGNRSLTRGTDSNGVGGWLNDIVPALKEGKDVGSVKMKPLGTIKGKALIDGKSEHYDITVYIPGTSYIARTDSDGSYNIYNVPEGTYKLRYTLDDHTPVMVEDVNLVCPENEENPTRIVGDVYLKSSYGTISGNTEGLEIQTVTLLRDGVSIKTVSSGANRSYCFERVESGTYTVQFSCDGYASYISDSITVTGGTNAIVNGGTLSSLYAEIKGTSFSEGETVSLTSNGVVIRSVVTTEDKSYSFSRLEAGSYKVTFSKEGYFSHSSDVLTVEAGSSVTMNGPSLEAKYGSASGRIILLESPSSSGAVVTITWLSNESRKYTAVTADDGTWSINEIPEEGAFSITVTKDGYISSRSNTVTVSHGSVANAGNIELVKTASKVRGTITLEGSGDHTGILLVLKTQDGSVQYDASTDEDGAFTFTSVMPGEYMLLASKVGYVSKTVDGIIVGEATTKTVEAFSLKVGSRSIVGSVSLENSLDHSGALVTATKLSDSTKVYSAITNSEGTYTLAGLEPGEYSIVISRNGYRSETLPTVNVVSTSTLTIPVKDILINRGTISGTVTLEGRMNHTGITVELMRGMDVYETTTTDSTGSYSFYVPQSNYSGVRYSMTDFETGSVSRSIALFADNYVSMGDSVLTATHNTVYGRVDVLTTDDESTVSVSFDGIDSIAPIVTEADGSFSFEHVPLGSYVIRFRRTDCSDITVPVDVSAADGINLNTITLTPNTATVKGKVTLRDALSNNGVTVSIDMGGGKVLSTTTDNSGRYEIGGVSVADTYTVTYTKYGWDSASQTLSTRLNVLEVRELDEVEMVDTTAPLLMSVTINNGSNVASDKAVILHIDAEDGGSGLKTMVISDSNTSNIYDYSGTINWTLESSNGLKTVRVKVIDRAGNESEIVSASVTLTDQKTTVSGVLKGDNLTWTKENSPYLVTGNIMVEGADTLTIEAGVDVQFNDNYFIQVEGRLLANGTESERINFYGVGIGEDNWDGMRFINAKGSILSYVDIDGIKNGITGYCDIEHAQISTEDWALGKKYPNNGRDQYYDGYCLIGNVEESVIDGSVSIRDEGMFRNEIHGENVYLYQMRMVADNTMDGTISIQYSNVDGNIFSGDSLTTADSFLLNNKIMSTTVTTGLDIVKNTDFIGCNIFLGWHYKAMDGTMDLAISVLSEVQFTNCVFSKYYADVTNSNFINCGAITVTSNRNTQRYTLDAFGNYWGDINTVELRSNGHDSDLSFIHDYMDDFNLTRVDVSGWKDAPISNIGYMGDGYGREELDSNTYEIGGRGPAGGFVFYDKGIYSDGWRYIEVAPSSILGDVVFGFYRPDGLHNNMVGTSIIVGTGKYNTERLVEYMDVEGEAFSESSGINTAEYAARKCLDYEYGEYNDWFLPSRNELQLVDENLFAKGILSISSGLKYWSSTEMDNEIAWIQRFGSSSLFTSSRDSFSYFAVLAARVF